MKINGIRSSIIIIIDSSNDYDDGGGGSGNSKTATEFAFCAKMRTANLPLINCGCE